jgi:hypothetical protein
MGLKLSGADELVYAADVNLLVDYVHGFYKIMETLQILYTSLY